MNKHNKKNQMGEKLKTAVVGFLDRRKHTANENIRLAVIVSAIIFAIGIFYPMLGSTVKFSMMDASKPDESAETVIFQPNQDIIKFSAGDLLSQKPLREFAVFGQEIGGIQIIGVNLYDTLTTPMPDFSGIKTAKNFLNSGALSILTNEDFVKFCTTNFGDFGQVLVDVGKTVNEISIRVGGILNEVTDVLDGVTLVSDNVREGIQQAESTVSTVEIIFAVMFVLILVMVLLTIFQKKPNYFAPVMMTIFSVVFVAIGIAVLVINAEIAKSIASGMNEINMSVEDLLNSVLPGLPGILAQFTTIDDISFILDIKLYCGTGWWLMTIMMIAMTVLSYVKSGIAKKELKAFENEQIIKQATAEAKKELKAEEKAKK